MFQEDFLLRQIRVLVDMAAKVTGLARDKPHEARAEVDAVGASLLGLDAAATDRLSAQDLLTFCTLGDFDGARAVAFAELLYWSGGKALQLYEAAWERDPRVRGEHVLERIEALTVQG